MVEKEKGLTLRSQLNDTANLAVGLLEADENRGGHMMQSNDVGETQSCEDNSITKKLMF